jgi:hypothetical protein
MDFFYGGTKYMKNGGEGYVAKEETVGVAQEEDAAILYKKRQQSNVQNQKILSSSREATLAYRPPREVEAFVLCPLPRHRRVQACTPQPRRGHKKARAKLEKRKISPFLHTRHNRERR